MKILHAVEFYAPSVGGVQEVMRQVSTRLARRGHDVTVVTSRDDRRSSALIDGVEVVEFDVAGNAARGMSGQVREYQAFLRHGRFDVVMGYAAQQWTVDAMLPILPEIASRRVLAPCGFSGLSRRRYGPYFRDLPQALRRFDAVVTHSGTYRDAEFLTRHGIPFTVIPNAADEKEFGDLPPAGSFRALHGIPPEAPLVILVGSHTGRKGHRAAISAFLRATSMRGGYLVIIGNSPLRVSCQRLCEAHAYLGKKIRRDRTVLLLDPPRPHVVAALRDADMMVVSSQVECSPLVMFEAAAAGLPVISVDVGNAVEILEWTGGGVVVGSRPVRGLVKADIGAMARKIDDLWGDPELRASMAKESRRAWSHDFTWGQVTEAYEDLYRSLVTASA